MVFPSTVRFPAKESLGNGTLVHDVAMPAPFTREDEGGWGYVVGEGSADDEEREDEGWLGEYAPLIVEGLSNQGGAEQDDGTGTRG